MDYYNNEQFWQSFLNWIFGNVVRWMCCTYRRTGHNLVMCWWFPCQHIIGSIWLSIDFYIPCRLPPSDPRGPLCPVSPCSPGDPTSPGDPGSPASPSGPGAPVVPWTPFAPLEPFSPTKPGSPTNHFSPITPSSPLAPLEPVLPCGPSTPADQSQNKNVSTSLQTSTKRCEWNFCWIYEWIVRPLATLKWSGIISVKMFLLLVLYIVI